VNNRVRPRPDQIQKYGRIRELANQDAIDPAVVTQASALARPHRPDDWKGIATEVHRWVRDGIRFQRDPAKREEFAPAATILSRRWDDCDGKARLAVALLKSLGIDAEIVPIWSAEGNLVHVQYRVRWPGSQSDPKSRNGWLIGETTVQAAELGEDPKDVPINHETGRLPLSG
jgi:transglutaminase-like putative cysteine protease